MTIKVDPDGDSIVTDAVQAPSTPTGTGSTNSMSTPDNSSTPKKPKSNLESQYGSVATPGGRRSARIASKSAQKKKK